MEVSVANPTHATAVTQRSRVTSAKQVATYLGSATAKIYLSPNISGSMLVNFV